MRPFRYARVFLLVFFLSFFDVPHFLNSRAKKPRNFSPQSDIVCKYTTCIVSLANSRLAGGSERKIDRKNAPLTRGQTLRELHRRIAKKSSLLNSKKPRLLHCTVEKYTRNNFCRPYVLPETCISVCRSQRSLNLRYTTTSPICRRNIWCRNEP